MAKLKVYISSTYLDLKDFREVLIHFFEHEGKNHFELSNIMERMYDEGSHEAFLDTCLNEVDKSDVYVIILLQSAGSFPPQSPDLTYTQHEFERALKRKKDNPKFKIFGFIYTGFDQNKCDNIAHYNALRNKFNGFPKSEFADIKDFQIQYLSRFFSLTENGNYILKRSPDQIKSTLDRQVQKNLFKYILDTHENDTVLFCHYQSVNDDAAHNFNYRLSNVELTSDLLFYKTQVFIRPSQCLASSISDDAKLTRLLVIEIADKLGLGDATTVMELAEAFSRHESTTIFIPFLLQHSIETTENPKRLAFYNRFFNSFSNPSVAEILDFRKVIFIVNFERKENTPEIDPKTFRKIYAKLQVVSDDNYLGNLNKLDEDHIRVWLQEKITGDVVVVNEFLENYFSKPYPKSMSTALNELENAPKIIETLLKNNQ